MKFVPNPSAFREIRRQPSFDAGMLRCAEAIKELAIRFSPPGSDRRRGHFRDRFVIEWIGGIPVVGNTDTSFFHLLEFGSVNNLPYAPLRRAVKAAGLRLEETPKR